MKLELEFNIKLATNLPQRRATPSRNKALELHRRGCLDVNSTKQHAWIHQDVCGIITWP